MTELPNLEAMDPDEWYDAVTELAERLQAEIRDVLANHTSSEEARDALRPALEPYRLDSDAGVDPARIDVWTEDDYLCIGSPGLDYAKAIYEETRGFWWYEPDRSDTEPTADRAHGQLARHALEATSWGDPEEAEMEAETAKRCRRTAAPYLEHLEEALMAGDPRAEELREPLVDLLGACVPHNRQRELRDVSPGDRRTHLEVTDRGEVSAHVLTVAPGRALDLEALVEIFGFEDLADLDGGVVATDHLRFVELAPVYNRVGRLRLPSKREEDLEAYNRAARTVVESLERLMRQSPISPEDEYHPVDDEDFNDLDDRALNFEFTGEALREPKGEDFYRPFLDLVAAWRRRRINNFRRENYDGEHFVERPDPDSEDFLDGFRVYPGAVREQTGALEGQVHYFFDSQIDETPPGLRFGIRVERFAQTGDNADGRLDKSWSIFESWVRNPLMLSKAWDRTADAGFQVVVGTVGGRRKTCDSSKNLRQFVCGELDDDETYVVEFARTVTGDDLTEWDERTWDEGPEHLDTLVRRMWRADRELVPESQSTARLLALVNELHPVMRNFYTAM